MLFRDFADTFYDMPLSPSLFTKINFFVFDRCGSIIASQTSQKKAETPALFFSLIEESDLPFLLNALESGTTLPIALKVRTRGFALVYTHTNISSNLCMAISIDEDDVQFVLSLKSLFFGTVILSPYVDSLALPAAPNNDGLYHYKALGSYLCDAFGISQNHLNISVAESSLRLRQKIQVLAAISKSDIGIELPSERSLGAITEFINTDMFSLRLFCVLLFMKQCNIKSKCTISFNIDMGDLYVNINATAHNEAAMRFFKLLTAAYPNSADIFDINIASDHIDIVFCVSNKELEYMKFLARRFLNDKF